jgi:5-methylcytosine-specific restriction endonuclease McrA
MKTCASCGVEKPIDAYYRDNRFLDGPPRAACKACILKRQSTPKKRRLAQPKECSKCGVLKPAHEFTAESRHADGLRSECKTCYFTPERYAQDQEWRKKNPERVRQYNLRSRPARDAYTIQWKKDHPELTRLQDARKRAKRRSNSGIRDLTPAQWKDIKAAYKFCCAYCGEKRERLTMDHVVPLVKGGAHTAANIVPACARCNSKKKEFDPPTHQPMLVH